MLRCYQGVILIQDYKDFAEYIVNNYPDAKRVLEIGVGKDSSVLKELKKSGLDVLAVDINPDNPETIYDDVVVPKINLYRDADLIYSIRPPLELYPYLEKLAKNINVPLLIRPLLTDHLGVNERQHILRNYKKSVFYEYSVERR